MPDRSKKLAPLPRHGRGRGRRNPDELAEGAELYAEFHGKSPRELLEIEESAVSRQEFVSLGDLVELRMELPDRGILKFTFAESDGVKLASSPNGKQLYFIGGDQNILPGLEEHGIDTSKDLLDLGDAVFVSYDAQKWQTNFDDTIWEHHLGEESGQFPRAFFDKFKCRIFLAGGNYRIEKPGIID
jgi:hypothetical protein